MLRKIEQGIFTILAGLVSLAVVALLALLTVQILSRYFRINLLAPPDEIITLIFAWMVFLGAALLVRNDSHLRVEFIDIFLQKHPTAQCVYTVIRSLFVLLFLGVMTSSGLTLFLKSGTRSSPILQLPQRLWYAVLPLSGFLMLLYMIARLVKAIIVFVNHYPESTKT
jgi:TRAP-type C4-dicarboxylate transport system permease small subunit